MTEPPEPTGRKPAADESVDATEAGSVGWDKFGLAVRGKNARTVNDRAGRFASWAFAAMGFAGFITLLVREQLLYACITLVVGIALSAAALLIGRALKTKS